MIQGHFFILRYAHYVITPGQLLRSTLPFFPLYLDDADGS
jgi:hypothetical protein